jgi:hypothetical protein
MAAGTKLEVGLQRFAFFIRSNPTLVGKYPFKGLSADTDTDACLLAFNGSLTHPNAKNPVDVSGRYYHAVQVLGLDGADSFKLQGTLAYKDEGWTDITGATALAANGITQFTGVFRQIRAQKNAGTGVATRVILMSMR